ncbi:hypothetical protein [Sinorhizobium psoraleae]|uniref:Uncharacterized protein n=1 Tax=Sinorhizobium psoraleae TaxID=520838 RepID=A0ABT4KF88_9HYPH|nr:hypothetical protein [Sinorhizobium psoraleae]MCZ4090611.1 hypothetical protein [Sinorhizobium psoraleae]
MSFENFKLLPKQKPAPADANTKRRLRFLSQIEKQIGFATSDPDRKRRGQWFWKAGDGSYVLSVRYGRRDIELSKESSQSAAQNLMKSSRCYRR